jgi:hypothetical protein
MGDSEWKRDPDAAVVMPFFAAMALQTLRIKAFERRERQGQRSPQRESCATSDSGSNFRVITGVTCPLFSSHRKIQTSERPSVSSSLCGVHSLFWGYQECVLSG